MVPLSSGHDLVDEVSGAAQQHDRELIADVVDEKRVDGPLVLLLAYLVVDGDLRVEQRRLERRHRQVAVEVGRLLLVVLVEQEDHLTPLEATKHADHELVQPVHGRANVRQRLVLGELVLAEVLRHRAHRQHGHVPEGRVACYRRQRALYIFFKFNH